MMISTTTKAETLQIAVETFWRTFPPYWNTIRAHIRDAAVNRFGITVEQFHILRNIRNGSGSVRELAEAKHISRPAISQAVDVLVDKGWVVRRQNPDDRRCVYLELTANGAALLEALFGDTRRWMMEKMAQLNPQELEDILRGMEALHKMADLVTA